MPFAIEFSDEANDDLQALRVYDQVRIVESIEEQLTHQPTVTTKHRKPVSPAPALAAIGATWELQVDAFRVLYDVVPETQVLIIRVIHKGTKTLTDALADASNINGKTEDES